MAAGPRRVLFLAEALFVGGMEEVVLLEAAHLDRSRFEPLVCVLSDKTGPVAGELRASGIEVTVLGCRTHRLGLALLGGLSRLVRERGVALIHAHDYKAALAARLVSRGRLPVVWSVHNPTYGSSKRWKRHLVNRLLSPWLDAMIGVSAYTCQAIARLDGPGPDKVVLLPNALNPARLARGLVSREEARQRLGVPEGTTLFLTVCRLEGQKGLPVLLAALSRLHENCRLALVGRGSQEALLRRQAGRLGLNGRVVFAGMQRELGPYFAAADAFVLPSLAEAMSLSLLEAMYAGLPVVSTNVGGTASVVTDGVTGLLVPPGDEDALAQAMSRMLADPEQARLMGEAGRRRVCEAFLPEHHVAALEALYDRVLRCRPNCGGSVT